MCVATQLGSLASRFAVNLDAIDSDAQCYVGRRKVRLRQQVLVRDFLFLAVFSHYLRASIITESVPIRECFASASHGAKTISY